MWMDPSYQHWCAILPQCLCGNILSKEDKNQDDRKGYPIENAIAEKGNDILKDELLEKAFPSFEIALREVAIACITYNHLRPYGSIKILNQLPSSTAKK